MRLNQVTIASGDVGRCAAFYERLGLKPIVERLPNYVRFLCPDGGSTFSICLDPAKAGGVGTVIYFECYDLDETVAGLEAKGVRFVSGPVDQPWDWREAHIRDPDGTPICLFSAGAYRVAPAGALRR